METRSPSKSTLLGLDWVNFFLADVQSGVGPFLAIYLAARGWNSEAVGVALTVGGLAGIIANTPAGALVDRTRSKRAVVCGGVVALSIGALLIACFPSRVPVLTAQILIGAASALFAPVITAISLGVVGHKRFDDRQGRNQAFNSAGNVFAAVAIALVGYFISNRGIFFFVVLLSVPTILSLLLMRPSDIDHRLARNLKDGVDNKAPSTVWTLLKDRPLLIFLVCAVLFHFANAAMLPLLGEELSRGKGRSSMAFMAACVITTQSVIALLASPTGAMARKIGRKPLLLIGFGVLPLRGVLYTVAHAASLLIAIQLLDGIGACVFGVVSVLVIADLTRGTGRFNLAQGAIAAAVGIGASLSQTFAGAIANHAGYSAGFLSLAVIAAIAVVILWLLMPETLESRAKDGPLNRAVRQEMGPSI